MRFGAIYFVIDSYRSSNKSISKIEGTLGCWFDGKQGARTYVGMQ
jgi:hypothetical protein